MVRHDLPEKGKMIKTLNPIHTNTQKSCITSTSTKARLSPCLPEQLPREPVRFAAPSPQKSAVVRRAVTAVQCNRTGSNLEGGVDSHTLQTIFRRNEKETKWKEKVE